jgi:hypothetical protein
MNYKAVPQSYNPFVLDFVLSEHNKVIDQTIHAQFRIATVSKQKMNKACIWLCYVLNTSMYV